MSEMKVCIKCDTEQPLENYNWRNKKRGVKHNTCKACHSIYRRQHYLSNQEMYKEKARRWNDENQDEHRMKVRRYAFEYLLENPCVDCGETNPLTLQFDHVRGIKKATVSLLISSTTSIKRVEDEIAKCEVRCANCHQIKTAKEGAWHIIDLMAEYGIDC